MHYFDPNANQLVQQVFGKPNKKAPQMSEEQFFSFTSTLDKESLQKLIHQARSRGISEVDIKKGVEILLQHR